MAACDEISVHVQISDWDTDINLLCGYHWTRFTFMVHPVGALSGLLCVNWEYIYTDIS